MMYIMRYCSIVLQFLTLKGGLRMWCKWPSKTTRAAQLTSPLNSSTTVQPISHCWKKVSSTSSVTSPTTVVLGRRFPFLFTSAPAPLIKHQVLQHRPLPFLHFLLQFLLHIRRKLLVQLRPQSGIMVPPLRLILLSNLQHQYYCYIKGWRMVFFMESSLAGWRFFLGHRSKLRN